MIQHLFILLLASSSVLSQEKLFPEDFMFGFATAAYQIEGGWNADGKGENIWDHLVHEHPELIVGNATGDVACDSYHKWKEDIVLLQELGAKVYRFSLSWARLFPTGFTNEINQAGVDYYNNLINGLLEVGIQPLVTLYHWDLPEKLQELGGFFSPTMEEYYAEYARQVFTLFGDRVKYWLTFNEPWVFCSSGSTNFAPGIVSPGIANYLCSHTVIKSHAKVYHIYHDEFKPTQHGKLSITLNCDFFFPGTNNATDIEAAERSLEFMCGQFLHPIFFGQYPEIMIERISARSELEGFPSSRLPVFTPEEQDYIKGTHDFLGLNHYSSTYEVDASEGEFTGEPSYYKDLRTSTISSTESGVGFRALLNWINEYTKGTEIFVTENGKGMAEEEDSLADQARIDYLQDHLISLLDAILEDNIKVIGYTAWSLMDNLEWSSGYSRKFGVYQVDFNSPNRTRTAKDSAKWISQVLKTRNPYINATNVI